MPFYFNFLTGLLLAVRARYLWLAAGFFLVLGVAALLASMFSGRQPATVALDVGLSVMRLLLPLIIVFMTQELLSREFDRRYFLKALAYPCRRHQFLLGRFFSVAVLAIGMLILMSLLLAALVRLIGQEYVQATPVALGYHYMVTIFFVAVDLLVLTALACLLGVVASTPSFVLIGTFGFMLVARSFAGIVELLNRDNSLVGDAESYRAGVGMLYYFLPDLGALDVRMVTLYGKMDLLPSDWHWLLLSSLSYIITILAVAVWALQRKRFV